MSMPICKYTFQQLCCAVFFFAFGGNDSCWNASTFLPSQGKNIEWIIIHKNCLIMWIWHGVMLI